MNGPLPFTRPEDTDLLDRLLGVAPLPAPDAWFTVRTLARCRSSRPSATLPLSWSRVWRGWAVAGVFTLCLAAFGLQQVHRNHTLRQHHQHRTQEAFEVISQVDNDSDLTWQDTSL